MGKSTISMAIFNSFLYVYQRVSIIFSLFLTSHFCQFSVKNSVPFRLEASKQIASKKPKSCLATAENFLHLPGTGPGWKSWNMDETNRFFGTGWGFSTLLSGFLKVCCATSTVDSFNNISCGLTVDSFSMSPWTKWWFSRGSIKTLSSDASFVDGLASIMKSGKNGVESSDWPVVFDVKSCGSSSPSLRWEQTKGETIAISFMNSSDFNTFP